MHQNELNDLAERIHQNAKDHGFWPVGGRNFGEMIALAHSELSEALEEHRAGNRAYYEVHQQGCLLMDSEAEDDGCTCHPKPEGYATELVDCIIRCLDTLHASGVDIDGVTLKKILYNESRPHKHGKEY